MKDEKLYNIVDDANDLSMVFGPQSSTALADAPVATATVTSQSGQSTDKRTLDTISDRLDEIDQLRKLLEEPAIEPPQAEEPLSATATISVVIPVRNMESTLTSTISRVMASTGHKEIILIDDMSIDCTPEILRQIELLPEVTVLYKRRQEGTAAAIRDGIRLARGKVIITYDPNSAQDPGCFSEMARSIIADECDVVYQSRFGNDSGRNRPNLCDRLISFFTRRATGQAISDVRAGCKAFRRGLLKDIALTHKGETFDYEVTARAALRGSRFKELAMADTSRETREKTGIVDVVRALYSYLTTRP